MPSGGGIRIIALTSVESPTARPHALISLQGHLPPGAGQGRGGSLPPQEFPSRDAHSRGRDCGIVHPGGLGLPVGPYIHPTLPFSLLLLTYSWVSGPR